MFFQLQTLENMVLSGLLEQLLTLLLAPKAARAVLSPWFDEWELQPGLPWQQSLERQIDSVKSAAVFVGHKGLGPWQDQELAAFLRQFVKRHCPVIPVILRSCELAPGLPAFLEGMTWVDFRRRKP